MVEQDDDSKNEPTTEIAKKMTQTDKGKSIKTSIGIHSGNEFIT